MHFTMLITICTWLYMFICAGGMCKCDKYPTANVCHNANCIHLDTKWRQRTINMGVFYAGGGDVLKYWWWLWCTLVDRSIHKSFFHLSYYPAIKGVKTSFVMAHIWQISQLMNDAHVKPRNFSVLGLLNSSSSQIERKMTSNDMFVSYHFNGSFIFNVLTIIHWTLFNISQCHLIQPICKRMVVIFHFWSH